MGRCSATASLTAFLAWQELEKGAISRPVFNLARARPLCAPCSDAPSSGLSSVARCPVPVLPSRYAWLLLAANLNSMRLFLSYLGQYPYLRKVFRVIIAYLGVDTP